MIRTPYSPFVDTRKIMHLCLLVYPQTYAINPTYSLGYILAPEGASVNCRQLTLAPSGAKIYPSSNSSGRLATAGGSPFLGGYESSRKRRATCRGEAT